MKTCNICGVPKDEFEFDKRKTGKISGYCKDCRKEKIKLHYRSNKQYYIDKAAKRNQKDREKFLEYKKSLVCEDCNLSFQEEPFLCDFHHLRDKDFNIANLKSYSFTRIMKEIKKCIPLCANCHRRRHNAPLAKLDKASEYESEDV